MAKVRKQKPKGPLAQPLAPIVNLAERRSVRQALQPGRKQGVFIAVPTVDGNVHFSISMNFGRAMGSNALAECPYQFSIHVEPGKRGIEYARNDIVKTFLNETDCDWLLMVDQDQVMPDDFWKLCQVTDADIVSALVPVWVANMDPETMLRVNNYGLDAQGRCYNIPIPDDSVTSPYRVPIVGTGAVAIRRRVFAPAPNGVGPTPFHFTRDDNGKVRCGEDINFSVAAQRCGFTLAVHPQVRFDHVKALPIWQVEAYYRARRAAEIAGKQITDEQRLSLG